MIAFDALIASANSTTSTLSCGIVSTTVADAKLCKLDAALVRTPPDLNATINLVGDVFPDEFLWSAGLANASKVALAAGRKDEPSGPFAGLSDMGGVVDTTDFGPPFPVSVLIGGASFSAFASLEVTSGIAFLTVAIWGSP